MSGNERLRSSCARTALGLPIEALEQRLFLSATLTPVSDTFVRDGDFTATNFGAAPVLFVKNGTSGDDRVSFLRFDLSNVSSIGTASLQLTGSLQTAGDPAVSVGVFAVPDNTWVEGDGAVSNANGDGADTDGVPAGEMTWNNQPLSGSTSLTTANVNRDTPQAYTWDLTTYLQRQKAAGNNVVSLAVKSLASSSDWVSFDSREAASGGPALVISDAAATPASSALSAPDISTQGTTPELVTGTYVPASGQTIDTSTILPSNLTVTHDSGGSLSVTGASFTQNAGTVTATYTVAAPSAGWTRADNGSYTISLPAGQVKDLSANPLPAATASFRVAVGDVVPPSASLTAPDVTTAGATTEQITAVYTDNVAVSAQTITKNNLSVTGPGGTLAVTGVTVTPSADAAALTAVYTVAAPAGGFVAADNGPYAVTLLPHQVLDTSQNAAAGAGATFNVKVTAPVTDTTPPTAAITSSDITATGSTSQSVVVQYTDNVAVDVSTIAASNLSVSGPSGSLTVTGVSVTPSGNNASLTATYTVAAPSGGWTAAANGAYAISLNASQVKDTSGNAAAAATGSFNVNIPAQSVNPTDPTFGGGQSVNTHFVSESVISLPDGRILVAGHEGDMSTGASRGVLERLNPDGSTDNSYGNNGQVLAPVGANDAYYGVVQQDANHVIAAGSNGGKFLLTRYDLAGNLDPTFGANGRTVTALGGPDDTIYALAFGPDGSIVAVGGSAGNLAFARFDANGNLDTAFGQGGKQLFNVGASNDVLGAVMVQPDGKVVAAGANGGNVIVVRLTAAGAPDASFHGNGLVTLAGLAARQDIGLLDRSEAIALQPDGKLLVANRTPSGHFGVARLNTDGSLDTGFGTGGIATANFGGDDDADLLFLQPTGEIFAVGTSLVGSTASTAVAEFDANGALVPSFGNSGLLTLAATVTPSMREIHVGDLVLHAFGFRQADGKLIVGTSDAAPKTTVSSGLTRIIVSNVSAQPTETLIGTFGIINKKNVKLTVTAADGTKIIYTLSGGSATAFQDSNGVRLAIADNGKGVSLSIKTRGANRVTLADVSVAGTLKSFSAPTSDLAGTLFAQGKIGSVSLGNVTGVIASGAGAISSLNLLSLSNAKILSGADLGSDNELGGTGANADTFAAGSINLLKVSGTIASSLIGAGLNVNSNAVTGGAASVIRSIIGRGGADQATHFVAGAFKSVRLPKKVNPANDSRFRIG